MWKNIPLFGGWNIRIKYVSLAMTIEVKCLTNTAIPLTASYATIMGRHQSWCDKDSS